MALNRAGKLTVGVESKRSVLTRRCRKRRVYIYHDAFGGGSSMLYAFHELRGDLDSKKVKNPFDDEDDWNLARFINTVEATCIKSTYFFAKFVIPV